MGVVLFEALGGALPYDGVDPFDVLMQIVQNEPPSLGMLREDLPPGLIEVVDRALTKDREARWRNAKEMAMALRRGVGLA